MDLSTDTAIYETTEGQLLMTVDSSGYATDKNGKPLGNFRIVFGTNPVGEVSWKLPPKVTWKFEPEQGEEIMTPYELLFDRAEPHVVGLIYDQLLAR